MHAARHPHEIDAGLQSGWFAHLVETLRMQVRRYQVYHRTMNELETLDDRELADLGLSRAMFPQLAREAASKA